MTYLLLLTAGLSFALQFCTNKYFQTYKPHGETYSVLFTVLGKISAVIFFVCCVAVSKAEFFGNGYTVLVGVIQATLNLTLMIVGLKVLEIGSVGLYTVSMMIGGMAVPAIFGAVYFHGNFGVCRIIAFIMITAGVVLSVSGEKKKPSLKAILLYAILFLCNGFIGVFSDLHVNKWGVGTNSFTFSFVTNTVAAVCYLPILLTVFYIERKNGILHSPVQEFSHPTQKILYNLSPIVTGILNGLGNLLIIICTAVPGVGSVVTFPLITGGTILFTSILSAIFYKEKFTLKTALGIIFILIALILYVI